MLILMAITACSPVTKSGKENMFNNKTFVHLFFNTEEECRAAQPEPDFFINCFQQLDFLNDQKVRIMLTDLLWDGTYKIQGNLIILSFEPNYEIPSGEIVFEIQESGQLIKSDDNSIWKEVSGNSIWN